MYFVTFYVTSCHDKYWSKSPVEQFELLSWLVQDVHLFSFKMWNICVFSCYYTTRPGLAWQTYDTQFRLLKSQMGMPWDTMQFELWLKACTDPTPYVQSNSRSFVQSNSNQIDGGTNQNLFSPSKSFGQIHASLTIDSTADHLTAH
jgi:hypothetical protein